MNNQSPLTEIRSGMYHGDTMRVFKLSCDVNKYQNLLWDTKGAPGFPFPDFNCEVIDRDKWPPGAVFSLEPHKRVPDIWAVGVGSGAFALGPRALGCLDMFGEMAGELLSLTHKGEELRVLNILHCLDCLDEGKSEWKQMRSTGRRRIVRPCIRSDRLTSSTLFKSAHARHDIFCWEDEGDPEYEFKAAVEANKLTGLLFEEVLVS